MLSFHEGEEVFFDTTDHLSFEESVDPKEDFLGKLGYEVWMNEPSSVKERRKRFLNGMGFVEFTHLDDFGKESEMMRVERIVGCTGAVSTTCNSSTDSAEEDLVFKVRELNNESNCMVDDFDHEHFEKPNEALKGAEKSHSRVEECKSLDTHKKKVQSWWKRLIKRRKENQCRDVSDVLKSFAEAPKVNRMKVRQNKKQCMEFTGVYLGQEIQAHKGSVGTMKFSPDGQYLASGGEDGVVRIWRVTLVDSSCKGLFPDGKNLGIQENKGKFSARRKKTSDALVVIPDKAFQIEVFPIHEFCGHTSDVLDLAWSKSNSLLSSSEDKTVRLWQVGCDECLGVFDHQNYVTCIQFNPADENYFISGSIDGKVRIWGVSDRRVVDWADVQDIVTAVCYQPIGNGFIVGSMTGNCRFYEASGSNLQLTAQIHINGRKKSSSNKITGIQFSPEVSQRVMITSEYSKLCILDGINVVHKYKGLPKSGSQMSASFTSTGRHIISVGEDSRIYVWNYNDPCIESSKHTRSVHSCEHFFYEGVSVAIPWSGIGTEQKGLDYGYDKWGCLRTQEHHRDSERFSLANWFSLEGSFRASATWPEGKLPCVDVPIAVNDHRQYHNASHDYSVLSATWGLVIVTAGRDGMIRTFHNYGLPIRI